ncbi:acetyl-coenzyme A transporter 1-like [Rhopalosiphum maidis]|uniref:acetyl-coenzyme A transporter 1-like n=1 Tax=Rhopalosiphum maidis TaxID=43146 RepID=UPI000EFE9D67|nr:acetyl-coenzyme A transporter 1-like [Rhopalosiphum maidis]XP_026822982.1 acetyl-coenzyme A transporter 1-like [Rhopalosiphum maidis]
MPSAIQEDEPTKSVVKNESPFAKSNLKGDWLNIFILFLLYIMQGLPLGIVNVIPILLQSKRNVTYNEQTLFSLTGWPFSLKLLWAPLVDALYIHKIGRRKSWLIPVQFSIGICFFYLADNINDLLLEAEKPNVLKLTSVFLISTFLVATQDIVVDGWALTLLQKNNVGYASTCAFVGQFTGIIISSMSLILLTSEDFSNKYLKISLDVGGIVTVKNLFLICGVLFMVITTSIAIFKNEKDTRLEDDHIKLNTFQNYKLLWDISNLPCIKILAIAMLTSFIGFAPNDSVVPLKLIDAGVPKGNIMVIQTGINVLKIIIMPVIAVKYTAGPKPMNLYLNVIPTRLLWNFTFVILIYYTPELIKNNGVVDIPMYYYVIFVFIQSINDILHNMMTTALVAFYCRISDARFGGTYITLLHGFSNIGGAFAKFIAYGLIDLLTFKECSFDSNNNCSTSHLQNVCKSKGGDCITIVNGYYVESIVCTVFEIIWFIIFKNKLKQLQSKSPSHWLVKMNTLKSKNHESSYTLKDVKT